MRFTALALCAMALAGGVCGQEKEESKDWPLLYKYIDLALPTPDGRKLAKESRSEAPLRKMYFDEDAQEAARLEVRPIKGLEDRIASFVKANLLRLKLSGITAVERDDVQPFLKTLMPAPEGLSAEEKKLLEGLYKGEEEAIKKTPKRGWIVEVRGYTFHHKGADFVRDSLVENLAALDEVSAVPDDVKEAVQDRVSFVMLYKTQMTKDGSDPGFKSPLRALAESGKLGAGAKALDKMTWKTEEKRGKEEAPVARTDFAVFLVWRAAAEKKGE